MAKKTGIEKGMFEQTEPEEQAQALTDEQKRVNPKGVGLMQYEWDEVDELAKAIHKDMSGHALAKWLLREAIKLYKAGQIKPKTKTRIELDYD